MLMYGINFGNVCDKYHAFIIISPASSYYQLKILDYKLLTLHLFVVN